MPFNLTELLELLRTAAVPADVFGALHGEAQAALKRRYHTLMAIAHPDHNHRQTVAANEACKQIQEWYAAAQREIAAGSYDRALRISVTTARQQYLGYEEPVRGDLCDLFAASAGGAQVLLKIARNPRNNDLLAAEAQALGQLDRELAGQAARAHFPTLIEQIVLRDADGTHRQANVLRAEPDVISLADVLRAYPRGIPAADAAWMFNRMLSALGLAHERGLLHGAVTPAHVLLRPADHNAVLIDWCYSVAIATPIKAISRVYAADYPPEVNAREPATPATDIYMAARCMARLLGGGDSLSTLPASVPAPLRQLLHACLIAAPQRRANDAWQVFDDFRDILEQLYGPPVFRPFRIAVPVSG